MPRPSLRKAEKPSGESKYIPKRRFLVSLASRSHPCGGRQYHRHIQAGGVSCLTLGLFEKEKAQKGRIKGKSGADAERLLVTRIKA